MSTLDWIGKEAVVKYRRESPYRLLQPLIDCALHSDDISGLQANAISS